MRPYQHITRDVDNAPRGPATLAFFDFDGTIIFGYSIATVMLEAITSGKLSPADALRKFVRLISEGTDTNDYGALLQQAAESLVGRPEAELVELGEKIFDRYLAAAIYPESRALIRAHQACGHTVAIVSSATPYQILPSARELGIEHVLCNELEIADGVFTGGVKSPVCFADGK
ncbi:MAG: HAD-IB family phosphatase, partial [Gammaproteobacteria bacterium]|nr:HAD-IB family phosphatase [Gammaproteobacteria bacterium]